MIDTASSHTPQVANWSLFFILGLYLLFFAFNPSVITDLRSFSFDDGTYSHAYLIPFVMVYFYWQAWRTRQLQPRINLIFLGFFIFTVLSFIWLEFAQQALPSRMLWPLVIMLALLSCFRFSFAFIVPTTLLWFITPIWGLINGILQQISVTAVSLIMKLTTIPTYVEGNMVHIPAGIFEIADGCSGLRYFVVSLALSIIFSFQHLSRTRSVLLFFALAIVGSLITNWLRIIGLIFIGHYTDMQSEIIADHNMFGWFLYIPYMILLFYIGSTLEQNTFENAETAVVVKPPQQWRAFSIIVLIFISAFSTFNLTLLSDGPASFSVSPLPTTFSVSETLIDSPKPQIITSENSDLQIYSINQSEVYFYRFSFSGNDASNNPNYYLNNMIPFGWLRVSQDVTNEGVWMTIRDAYGKEAVILYWYGINDSKFVSAHQFRLARLKQVLTLSRASDLHWYFAVCSSNDCSQAKQHVKTFL